MASSSEDEGDLADIVGVVAEPPPKKSKLHYKGWECPQCPAVFTQKGNLTAHVAAKHSDAPPSFACPECDKIFTQNSHLRQHLRQQHSDAKPCFECSKCDATFTRNCALNKHVAIKHNDSPPSFKCPECDATYTQKGHLNRHVATKHSAAPPSFSCPECDATFTEKKSLNQHLANAHDVGVVWHHCDADPNCTFKSKTGSSLARHIQSVHARVHAQRKQEQEEKVRRALLDGGWQEYQLAETMPPVGYFRREKRIDFTCAKKAQPGALATAGKFARIDFVLGVPGGYVFLEVDEQQHRFGYDNDSLSCDMKRMASVMESLAVETDYNLPNVYWLRFNPHAHRANGDLVKVPKAERERRLLAWLEAFAFAAPLGIGYAFYDYDDEDGLEVLANPDYDAQYAAVVDNLKALDDVDVDTDSEDQDVCLPCAD